MTPSRRSLALLVASVATAAVSEWLGEDGSSPVATLWWAVILGLFATAAVAMLSRGWHPASRIVLTLLAALITWSSYALGSHVESLAFNSCVERRDQLKVSLEQFRSRAGRYPASLTELPMELPGRRLLRGNLLRYHSDGRRYVLAFSDWLASHGTSEGAPWAVAK